MKIKLLSVIIILILINIYGVAAGVAASNCDCINNNTIKSDNSQNNFEYSLGLIIDPEKDPYLKNPVVLYGDPPPSWDWRDIDGKDFTTPIRNQAVCGSCYAFAPIGALEAMYNIKNNNPDLDIDLSEQFLISCSYGYPYWNDGCCGGSPGFTYSFLIINGIPLESCFPYQAVDSKGRDALDCPNNPPSNEPVRCKDRCSDWKNQVIKIGKNSTPELIQDTKSIKIAISTIGPVIASFEVYEDFKNYTEGVYKHQTGEYRGWHGVSIVGYNDDHGYWICKNSWGTDWGENGWFKIAYGECKIEKFCHYISSYIKGKSYIIPFMNIILARTPLLPYFLNNFLKF